MFTFSVHHDPQATPDEQKFVLYVRQDDGPLHAVCNLDPKGFDSGEIEVGMQRFDRDGEALQYLWNSALCYEVDPCLTPVEELDDDMHPDDVAMFKDLQGLIIQKQQAQS